jgi:hypothetical protein
MQDDKPAQPKPMASEGSFREITTGDNVVTGVEASKPTINVRQNLSGQLLKGASHLAQQLQKHEDLNRGYDPTIGNSRAG